MVIDWNLDVVLNLKNWYMCLSVWRSYTLFNGIICFIFISNHWLYVKIIKKKKRWHVYQVGGLEGGCFLKGRNQKYFTSICFVLDNNLVLTFHLNYSKTSVFIIEQKKKCRSSVKKKHVCLFSLSKRTICLLKTANFIKHWLPHGHCMLKQTIKIT